MTRPRILFVSHTGSRSGAPGVLFHFLSWLSRNEVEWDIEIVLNEGGPFADRFAELAPTRVINEQSLRDAPLDRRELLLLGSGRMNHDAVVARRIEASLGTLRGFDLVYMNSAVSASTLPQVIGAAPRLISHLHELRFALGSRVQPYFRRMLLERSTRFIACSHAVAASLTSYFEVPPERVDTVHEFIEVAAWPLPKAEEREAAREALGIAPGSLVVAGAGRLDWAKGADLFVQLAHSHRRRDTEPARFLWAGGVPSMEHGWEVLHALESTSSGADISFIPETADLRSFLCACDVLALTSREDSFPLISLEAAALGVPTICWDTGGMPEFVERGAGIVVPFGDIGLMAEGLDVLRNETTRQTLGARARTLVVEHHDVDRLAPRIRATIDAVLAQPGA